MQIQAMVAATMEKRGRTQFFLAITAVLALHLAIIWALLASSHGFTSRTESRPLEIVLIAPSFVPNDRITTRVPDNAVPRRRSAPKSSPSFPAPTRDSEGDAIQAPIDWVGELERSVENSAFDDGSKIKRDFGFPRTPSTGTAKRPEFGWDRAATHRLEVIPEGGLLVNLNDNCVLVLLPLPFAGCAIGMRKANGDLFAHMQDSLSGETTESR